MSTRCLFNVRRRTAVRLQVMVVLCVQASVFTAHGADWTDGDDLQWEALGHSLPYRLYSPPDPASNQDYPLVLFLHGAGERGTDNELQVKRHIAGLIDHTQGEHGEAYKAYLIAPQAPPGAWRWSKWNQVPVEIQMVEQLIEHTVATRNVDPRRIYVTGLSMGAYGSFQAMYSRPDIYAAALPMGGYIDSGPPDQVAAVIKDIPTWLICGENDTNIAGAKSSVAALENVGGQIKHTWVTNTGHSRWSDYYHDSPFENFPGGVYDWMFAQTNLDAPAPKPTVPGLVTGWQEDIIFEQVPSSELTYTDYFYVGHNNGRLFETGTVRYEGFDGLPVRNDQNVAVITTSQGNRYQLDYTRPHATSQDVSAEETAVLTIEEPGRFSSISFLGSASTGNVLVDFILNEGDEDEIILSGGLFRAFQTGTKGEIPSAAFDGYAGPYDFRNYAMSGVEDSDGYLTEAIFDLSVLGFDDTQIRTITIVPTSGTGRLHILGVSIAMVPEPGTAGVLILAGGSVLLRQR